MVLIVTGLRPPAGVAPMGECELHRACAFEAMIRGSDGDREVERVFCGCRINREDIRQVFMRARDMVLVSLERAKSWLSVGNGVVGVARTERKSFQLPSLRRTGLVISLRMC